MQLAHEFDFRAMLRKPVDVGAGPFGVRRYLDVTEGRVEGERISGEFLSGGDWMLIGSDGYARLEVRIQVQTGDGAVLYISFPGMVEMNEKVQHALASETETDYGDQYWRVTPTIETGDERYSWLNRTVFVAEGRVCPGFGVEYRVYRVT